VTTSNEVRLTLLTVSCSLLVWLTPQHRATGLHGVTIQKIVFDLRQFLLRISVQDACSHDHVIYKFHGMHPVVYLTIRYTYATLHVSTLFLGHPEAYKNVNVDFT
jgi:hypothetical protein